MRRHARDFCARTTIHGLKYVAESGVGWWQSVVWSVLVMVGAALCCILMSLVWERFYSNPTITTVESINYPIWNIPFPAVTICNSNKVQKSKTKNIEKILIAGDLDDADVSLFFRFLSNLIVSKPIYLNFTREFRVLAKSGYDTESLMLELMQPCDELLRSCTWMGDDVACSDLFRVVKTDEGFCCAFNYFFNNETFDVSSDTSRRYKDNALHTSGAGVHTGLAVALDLQEGQYVSATRAMPSAAVHVHEGWDYPEVRALGVVLEEGALALFTPEPIVIDSTDDVRTLPPARRGCYFEEEEEISIGSYGYENCLIECRMDAIVDLCGCVPFYYNVQKYTYKNVSKFCEMSDMLCVHSNAGKLYSLSSAGTKAASSGGLNCSCLPTCDVFWYPYLVDMAKANDPDGAATKDVYVHVYFRELSCVKYKQSALNTWDGLFASFGGIFGLCLGGSMLSLAEVIYHFTIGLWSRIRQRETRRGEGRFTVWLVGDRGDLKQPRYVYHQ